MKNIILCDIDGTICEPTEEQAGAAVSENWEAYNKCDFLKNKPRHDIIHLLDALSFKFQICFISSRSEALKEITNKWLQKNIPHNVTKDSFIFMRGSDDYSTPEQLKEKIVNRYIGFDNVALIIDDDTKVLKVFNKYNIPVINTGYFNYR